jgi:DNA polymerase III delta subunit
MLTVLVGQNVDARAKHLEKILTLEREKENAVVFYNDVNFNKEEIIFSAQSVSLFGKKTTYVLSGIYDNTEKRNDLENILKDISESEEHFILSEKSLLAPFVKKLTTLKVKIEKLDDTKVEKKEVFNVFALTDAYCDKKRGMAWAIYRAGISSGVDAYELHGKIVWAIKNMILVKKTSSPVESGLHPYVYGKTKKAAENFSIEVLQKNIQVLSILFHEALFSGLNLETSLESFILKSLE